MLAVYQESMFPVEQLTNGNKGSKDLSISSVPFLLDQSQAAVASAQFSGRTRFTWMEHWRGSSTQRTHTHTHLSTPRVKSTALIISVHGWKWYTARSLLCSLVTVGGCSLGTAVRREGLPVVALQDTSHATQTAHPIILHYHTAWLNLRLLSTEVIMNLYAIRVGWNIVWKCRFWAVCVFIIASKSHCYCSDKKARLWGVFCLFLLLGGGSSCWAKYKKQNSGWPALFHWEHNYSPQGSWYSN